MRRPEQLNNELMSTLARLINNRLTTSGYLLTVSWLEPSHDLNNLKIGLSVLPEKFSGTALKAVRAIAGELARELTKSLKLKRVPKLEFISDRTEEKVAELEEVFREIKN